MIGIPPSSSTSVGKLLRLPLRFVPKSAAVWILRGRARGLRWIAGAGPHGIWLGHYEPHIQRALASHLVWGSVLFDIGANAGYFSLLGSRLVGASGRVFGFEPLPENIELFRRHVEINGLANVAVVEAAVARTAGRASLSAGSSRFTARLDASGRLSIRTIALDDEVGSGRLPAPSVIKIDVEGAELEVLEGARTTLKRHGPVVILATHGSELLADCRQVLEGLGFEVRALAGNHSSGWGEFEAIPGRVMQDE